MGGHRGRVRRGRDRGGGIVELRTETVAKDSQVHVGERVPISTLQVQYHLLSRFPELNGTKETCDELGIQLIAYSPLALGLLTGNTAREPTAWHSRVRVQGRVAPLPTLLETMREVGEAHGGKTPRRWRSIGACAKTPSPFRGRKHASTRR